MLYELTRLDLHNELDIVLAHRYGMQLAEMAGMSIQDQTRTATSVSEIARTCVQQYGGGTIIFGLTHVNSQLYLQMAITFDEAVMKSLLPYLADLRKTSDRPEVLALRYSARLCDYLKPGELNGQSYFLMGKKLPRAASLAEAPLLAAQWRDRLLTHSQISPYEELKSRNTQLLRLTEELSLRNLETEQQLGEISRLNQELAAKNNTLLLARNQAEESSGSFEFLSRSIPQIIFRTSATGTFEQFNYYWEQYAGSVATEDLCEAWLDHLPEEERDLFHQAWLASVESGENFTHEHRLLRHDGNYRWHLTKAQAIRDVSGAVRLWIGTSTDIDEHKRWATELERLVNQRTTDLTKAIEELKRSNRDLEQFAYVASHDLREPIRMVSSFTKLLESRFMKELGPVGAEFMSFILEGAERMENLINDLLTYSRIGRRDTLVEDVDLNQVLDAVKHNLHEQMVEKKAVITQTDLPTVRGIRSTLVQLLQNLIENAMKFCGDKAPEIHIAAEKWENEWLFSVRDRGIGIEEQFSEKVFVIFQRLHGRDEYPGTGIGLAICKKIVEMYHGRIWFESTPGTGTVFYFTLPANSILTATPLIIETSYGNA